MSFKCYRCKTNHSITCVVFQIMLLLLLYFVPKHFLTALVESFHLISKVYTTNTFEIHVQPKKYSQTNQVSNTTLPTTFAPLSVQQCKQLHIDTISNSSITYVTQSIREHLLQHAYHAPYLVSYPGSGNTITRLGIEYMTQYYTSSIHNDKSLYNLGFLGENITSINRWKNAIIVKLHPNYANCNSKRKLCNISVLDLAKKYNVASIFIQRNPIDAIFADFQWTYGQTNNILNMSTRHVAKVPLEFFENNLKKQHNGKFCQNFATTRFKEWNQDFQDIEIPLSEYKNDLFTDVLFENLVNVKNINVMIHEWLKIVLHLFKQNFLWMKLGDIIENQNKSVKHQTYYEKLSSMLDVNKVGIGSDNNFGGNLSITLDSTILDVFAARIQCFFKINTHHPRMVSIHRPKSNVFHVRKTSDNGTPINQTFTFVTKQDFWNNVPNYVKCHLMSRYRQKLNHFHYVTPAEWHCDI